MKFDIEKFMMVTALLASATVATPACQSDDDEPGQGNESGGSAGKGGTNGAGGNAGGNGGDGAGEGGMTAVAGQGGSGEQPSQAGGAGGTDSEGAAGAGGQGECLGDVGDPSIEFPCDGIVDTDCDAATELLTNPALDYCSAAEYQLRPDVLLATAECLKEIEDPCSETATAEVQNCIDEAAGNACESSTTGDQCTAIHEDCTDLSENDCAESLDALNEGAQITAADCMDPTGETFDAAFEGTCVERFAVCVSLTAPPAL
jgi:hypothetical protein